MSTNQQQDSGKREDSLSSPDNLVIPSSDRASHRSEEATVGAETAYSSSPSEVLHSHRYEVHELASYYALVDHRGLVWGVLSMAIVTYSSADQQINRWLVIRRDPAHIHSSNLSVAEIWDPEESRVDIVDIIAEMEREPLLNTPPYKGYPPPAVKPYRFISGEPCWHHDTSSSRLREVPAFTGVFGLRYFECVAPSEVVNTLGEDLLPVMRRAREFQVLRPTEMFRQANIKELVTAVYDCLSVRYPGETLGRESFYTAHLSQNTPVTELTLYAGHLEVVTWKLASDLIELYDCRSVIRGISSFFGSLTEDARDHLQTLGWTDESVAQAAATFEQLGPLKHFREHSTRGPSENDADEIWDEPMLLCSAGSSIDLVTLDGDEDLRHENDPWLDTFLGDIGFPNFDPWNPEQSPPNPPELCPPPEDTSGLVDTVPETCKPSDFADSKQSECENSTVDYSEFLADAMQAPLTQQENEALRLLIAACKAFCKKSSPDWLCQERIEEIGRCINTKVINSAVELTKQGALQTLLHGVGGASPSPPSLESSSDEASLVAIERSLTRHLTEVVCTMLFNGAPKITGQTEKCDDTTRQKIQEFIHVLVSSDACGLRVGLEKLKNVMSASGS
jgi:hypothetical protein